MKKRNKKWWALTEKQRRHDKSVGCQAWANAPRWYKHVECVKPWKVQCKAVMSKAFITGDFDGMVFPVFKKDANYNWW